MLSSYERFRQLDRNAKSLISTEEFLSVPEIAVNPLPHRLLKAMDDLYFKDFVAFLSAFSAKASVPQILEFIFKIYDLNGNREVSFDDVLEVLQDLIGSFLPPKQREIQGNSELKMDVEIPVE